MISNCWPNLRQLSVGGPGITSTGLIYIGEYEALRLQNKRNSHSLNGAMSDQITKDDNGNICTSGTEILRHRRSF